MAQTPEGAIKQRAVVLGISLEELLEKQLLGLKRCTKCKEWKHISGFGKDRTRGDGINPTCSKCKCVKQKKNRKGCTSYFKGKTHTAESKRKMSEARLGNKNRIEKYHTEETKQKLREISRQTARRGKNSPHWKGGTSDARKVAQVSFQYRDWRRSVFARDKYTCQSCGDDRGGNLHAHHVKAWAKFPELRYEIDNGLTLCRECHERVHLKPIPTYADIKRRKKHGAQ